MNSELAKIEYLSDKDMDRAAAVFAGGKCTLPEYLEWCKGRSDELVAKTRRESSRPNELRLKVSEKGALSVYGLNVKFPVTLYAGQWERLIAYVPKIQQALKDNAAQLVRK